MYRQYLAYNRTRQNGETSEASPAESGQPQAVADTRKGAPHGWRPVGISSNRQEIMHLTIYEVSKRLRLPVNTLQRWVRQGKIPVYNSDNGYFFIERELKEWAQARGLFLATGNSCSLEKKASCDAGLIAALKRGKAIYDIDADSVSGVLRALVDVAPVDRSVNRTELFQMLIAREDLSSTGVGRGVAIPHPRTPLKNGPMEPMVTACFLSVPIEYGAIDGIAVFVLFMMLTPSTKIHLGILGNLSHFLRDSSFIAFLEKRPSQAELLARVEKMESEAS